MRTVFVVRFVNTLKAGGKSSTLVTTPLVCESRSDAEAIVAMYGSCADMAEVPYIPEEEHGYTPLPIEHDEQLQKWVSVKKGNE